MYLFTYLYLYRMASDTKQITYTSDNHSSTLLQELHNQYVNHSVLCDATIRYVRNSEMDEDPCYGEDRKCVQSEIEVSNVTLNSRGNDIEGSASVW